MWRFRPRQPQSSVEYPPRTEVFADARASPCRQGRICYPAHAGALGNDPSATRPHPDHMIRLENVTKNYKGDVVALRDVSADIQKGEFVFLVGPSGSGKSTFIRLLLKEQDPDSGRIWVAGKDIANLSSFKVPYLRRKHVIHSQVPQILDLVGLTKKRDNLPSELSGGEQQRVSIARAFVNRPLILLADEPTGNLDPSTSVGIMRLLDRINRTGTTVLMATHDQSIVDTMRRRVIELDRGTLVRDQARGVYGAFTAR